MHIPGKSGYGEKGTRKSPYMGVNDKPAPT